MPKEIKITPGTPDSVFSAVSGATGLPDLGRSMLKSVLPDIASETEECSISVDRSEFTWTCSFPPDGNGTATRTANGTGKGKDKETVFVNNDNRNSTRNSTSSDRGQNDTQGFGIFGSSDSDDGFDTTDRNLFSTSPSKKGKLFSYLFVCLFAHYKI
jgi:hypothetical protein